MQYNAKLTKSWWLLYCSQWYRQRWCDKWCYQIVKNNILKNIRSLIANSTKKFRNIYDNAMMTNDLSFNDKHVFISDFVIDSRQTDLRLVVDKSLTIYVCYLIDCSHSVTSIRCHIVCNYSISDFSVSCWIAKDFRRRFRKAFYRRLYFTDRNRLV